VAPSYAMLREQEPRLIANRLIVQPMTEPGSAAGATSGGDFKPQVGRRRDVCA